MSYLPTEPPLSPQADDLACISRAVAEGLRPDPRRTLSEWAEAERIVAEGSAPGPWSNRRAPFLTEVMDKLTLRHPCQRVTLVKSAQVGGSQIGLNFLGQVLSETPAACLVVLPSLDSMRMFNRDKLDRMIRTTPALASAVADITSRDGAGSTTTRTGPAWPSCAGCSRRSSGSLGCGSSRGSRPSTSSPPRTTGWTAPRSTSPASLAANCVISGIA
jgi:hypothetical protein